ncbi:hypothetical protein [Rossellomorea marisflavi]|uniref:hypothetical protein n=1 Tax=Rossellomorea marisflavi TaxID=189381 RepID=UPI00345827D9
MSSRHSCVNEKEAETDNYVLVIVKPASFAYDKANDAGFEFFDEHSNFIVSSG